MDNAQQKNILHHFFSEYETRVNWAIAHPAQVDIEGMAAAFAKSFLGASPIGIACAKNDEQFQQALQEGMAFYRSIGTTAMKIVSLSITPLDDIHFMNTVHWLASYIKKNGETENIKFDVIYLVQLINDQPKIFTYITGDEQKVFKERGLQPETEQRESDLSLVLLFWREGLLFGNLPELIGEFVISTHLQNTPPIDKNGGRSSASEAVYHWSMIVLLMIRGTWAGFGSVSLLTLLGYLFFCLCYALSSRGNMLK